jgi:tripartite-type tricarboxylate transporter receptor subunit TctC
MKFKTLLSVILIAGAMISASQARADDANYYAGKTVTVIVGYAPGGGFSTYAQMFAKYLSRHIPGNPTVIVQHMPGAGSVVAANYIYNVSKPDGLTIGAISTFNLYSSYMTKANGVQFDLAKMAFVGNLRSGNGVLMMRADEFSSLDRIKNSSRPVVMGEGYKGSNHHLYALALEEGMKVNFQHIFGYNGGNDLDLALQRKEVDGRVGNLNTYLVSKPDWIHGDFIKILTQNGKVDKDGKIVRDSRIPDVPTVDELFPGNKKVQQLMDFVAVSDELAGVYIMPPSTPADLAEILRGSFMATLEDPDFNTEAKKYDLELTPMTASEVQLVLGRALNVSDDIIKQYIDLSK